MAQVVVSQHAQRIGRKLELCMPINEVRRRSLESRGACTLRVVIAATRRDTNWRHAHQNTFHVSRARYRCQSNVRYFHPLFKRFTTSIPALPSFVQISKYHCYSFFSYASPAACQHSKQQQRHHRSPPPPSSRAYRVTDRHSQSKVEQFDFTMMAPVASS